MAISNKKLHLDANFELALSQYFDPAHSSCAILRSMSLLAVTVDLVFPETEAASSFQMLWSHLGKEMRSSDTWNSFSFLHCSVRHCMDHGTAKVRACWQIAVKQLSAIGQTRWHVMTFCITMYHTARNQDQSHTWYRGHCSWYCVPKRSRSLEAALTKRWICNHFICLGE